MQPGDLSILSRPQVLNYELWGRYCLYQISMVNDDLNIFSSSANPKFFLIAGDTFLITLLHWMPWTGLKAIITNTEKLLKNHQLQGSPVVQLGAGQNLYCFQIDNDTASWQLHSCAHLFYIAINYKTQHIWLQFMGINRAGFI